MAIYEYRYTDVEGRTHTVERTFRMGAAPARLVVEDGDEVYRAERIISLTAKMKNNWAINASDFDSALPDVDAPVVR